MLNQAHWNNTGYTLLPVKNIFLRDSISQTQENLVPLESLAASIDREGLREPITVSQNARGYVILHGNRRLMACRMLGWTEIPAFVQAASLSELPSAASLLQALRQRPLFYLDMAEGIARLNGEFQLNRADIAAQLGENAVRVTSLAKIGLLDEETRTLLRTHHLSERTAEALTRLPDAESRLRVARKAVAEQLDIREIELLVNTAQRRLPVPQLPRRIQGGVRDVRPYLNALRDVAAQMQTAGLPVEFTESTDNGHTTLTIRLPHARRRRSQSVK